ncbi:MAG: UTP--glucose-1-phosphate uridylyltransferase [Bdellovibrionaceae bacterium]|nr:UTP--glucose-1-phosphate uridylyltransferase [Pseudobdellovibrionaceae bacterium]|tara:strand:- start:247509 stop:248396 length:888 start_codon:yes stop_codon:yes gene_type:complete
MNSSIKKAVIPAAGLGTRFLPATKTIPKEMLPIVDQPTILYVVEECVRAGIEDIVLIAGRGKSSIEDFFDRSVELEETLERSGKTSLLSRIQRVRDLANVISIRQKEALGLGHAIYTSKPIVGNEPFAVLLGDEIMIPRSDDELTATEQLVNVFNKTDKSAVAVMPVEDENVHKYGIISHSAEQDGVYTVDNVIEKPSLDEAPSRLALPGRYVFTPKIFDFLKNTPPGKNGEIQLTDPMAQLAKDEGMSATVVTGRRFDAGDKLGYLMANIEMGLEHPEVGEGLKNYIKGLASQF